MEPALEVLAHSLQGDADARAFMDRTASIYVLDVASDPSQPKLFGCWNFIHQSLNEVQRLESAPAVAVHADDAEQQVLPSPLTMHVRLLATLALRVARRSITADQRLAGICLSNAAKYSASPHESEQLVALNTDLRDIVLGRIAALTFDPPKRSRLRMRHQSAFCDVVVQDTFAAVLAANAASNGPSSVRHLLHDWIIPSFATLPPRAVAQVVAHLAQAADGGRAPAGTQETLQTLSASVIGKVLGPLLQRAIKGADGDGEPCPDLAVAALRAMQQWRAATDLSLAQIKHVCSKVEINFVEILSDAMYSCSGTILDALADFMEYSVLAHDMTEARMTQVRLLMQVDEVAFRSNVRSEQLLHIERKELSVILEELQSAIGLQRFRFLQRQTDGDYGVCRSLTRIAAATCALHTAIVVESSSSYPNSCLAPGVLDLLLKATSHPSIHICALSIDALSALVPQEVGLSLQLLPVLQRRAITPHKFEANNVPTLDESFDTFVNFRDACLCHALATCYRDGRESFVASCTSAVEEFCDPSTAAGVDVSFHLEAALFCLSAVTDDALQQDHAAHLKRCTVSLSAKPSSMMRNPLTLRQVCRFLHKYDRWYCRQDQDSQSDSEVLSLAADLALTVFTMSASNFPNEPTFVSMRRHGDVSPFANAALALGGLLSLSPQHFLSNPAIAALGAAWEASYTASNRFGILTVDDRQALCVGICHVLAALPDDQRANSLQALAMPGLDCLNTMVQMASNDNRDNSVSIYIRISHEVLVLKTMARTFTDAYNARSSGCSTSDDRGALSPPAMAIVQRAMPSISTSASKFSIHSEDITDALCQFLVECLPPSSQSITAAPAIVELCAIVHSMIQPKASYSPIFIFLQALVRLHGSTIDEFVRTRQQSSPSSHIYNCLKTLLKSLLSTIEPLLGNMWHALPPNQRQGNGQLPFESKEQPEIRIRATSNEALPNILYFFSLCCERCPIFLLTLEDDQPSEEESSDLSQCVYRAMESAIESMMGTDVETSRSSILFLTSLTDLATQSTVEIIRTKAQRVLTFQESSTRICHNLLLGICGNMSLGALEHAARLLYRMLRSAGGHSLLTDACHRDPPFASSAAMFRIVMSYLRRVPSESALSTFATDLWTVQKHNDHRDQPASDAAVAFCKTYGVAADSGGSSSPTEAFAGDDG